MSHTLNHVSFPIGEGLLAYQGIAAIESINAEGESVISLVTFGDPTPTARIGLLQAALDRQRELMRRCW